MAAVAVMRASHRAARVTAAPAAALRSLSHEVRDTGIRQLVAFSMGVAEDNLDTSQGCDQTPV